MGSAGETIAFGGFEDSAVGRHGGEALIEGGGANAASGPEIAEWLGLAGLGEGRGDAVIEGVWLDGGLGGALAFDDLEGESVVTLNEVEGERGHGRRGAVFDGERDAVICVATQIEVGIAPGVELGGTAERLTGAHGAGAFPGVVDEDDSEAMAALEVAQVGEQRGDLAADILVDAMQADERIEDEHSGLQRGDGLVEFGLIGLEIEPQAGRGDDLDVDVGQLDRGGGADAVEPATDDVQGVLGGVEQHATGVGHGEAAQTGPAGGDGDGQIEGEEGFAAFGLAADDADGLLGPQVVDQPSRFLGPFGQAMGGNDGKRGHRRLPATALG